MADYNIPENIKRGIDRYAENGVPTGDFLKAVLCNNLFESFGRADTYSEAALKQILQYVYNEIPGSCWGSPEKYKAWIEKHAKAKEVSDD